MRTDNDPFHHFHTVESEGRIFMSASAAFTQGMAPVTANCAVNANVIPESMSGELVRWTSSSGSARRSAQVLKWLVLEKIHNARNERRQCIGVGMA